MDTALKVQPAGVAQFHPITPASTTTASHQDHTDKDVSSDKRIADPTYYRFLSALGRVALRVAAGAPANSTTPPGSGAEPVNRRCGDDSASNSHSQL
jgi:hypothetical protein